VSARARSPFTIVEEEDARSIAGRHFWLSFARVGDRWTHAVLLSRLAFGPREMVAKAQEWDAERDDPARVASPVFQELQIQTDPAGRPQALLLGMSGRHHFSAAFLMDEVEGEVTLSVDVADRSRDEGVSTLASTYLVATPSSRLVAGDELSIAWDWGIGRLTCAAGPWTRLSLAEAGRSATRVQALAEIGVAGATRRWQYSWSLSPLTA
jgi:hypothetical protein